MLSFQYSHGSASFEGRSAAPLAIRLTQCQCWTIYRTFAPDEEHCAMILDRRIGTLTSDQARGKSSTPPVGVPSQAALYYRSRCHEEESL